jgi:hypothetical protein
MRVNTPWLSTFGGGRRFNVSQHFYSRVSVSDKVPRRSAPFHVAPLQRPDGEKTNGKGSGWRDPEPVTGSSGPVFAGLTAGENPGMKRFPGNVGGEMRHDAEETADARDTTA